jgi:Tfp pilus assembly protein PilF
MLTSMLSLGSALTQSPHAESQDLKELDRAQALSQAGSQGEAEQLLLNYLQQKPGSERAHALLGLVRFREGSPEKSLDEYSLAARSGSLNGDDLRIVGLDYVQLHDLPSAERWLKASTDRNPHDWRTWRYLGGVEYSEERPLEAAKAYRQCLQLHPEDALAEDGLARSDEALGQTEEAGEEYRQAVLHNSRSGTPSWLPLMHYGSYLRRTHSRLPEALASLKQAEQLSSKDWEVHAELGQAYEENGMLQDAQDELQKAIVLAPDRGRLHVILGRVYQREGKKDEAAAEFKLYAAFASTVSPDRGVLDR